jgi:hypothetical protein
LFGILAGKVFKFAVMVCDGYFIAGLDVTTAGKISPTPFDDMWSKITILCRNFSKLPTIIIIENCYQFHNFNYSLLFLFSAERFFNYLLIQFITISKLEFLRLAPRRNRSDDRDYKASGRDKNLPAFNDVGAVRLKPFIPTQSAQRFCKVEHLLAKWRELQTAVSEPLFKKFLEWPRQRMARNFKPSRHTLIKATTCKSQRAK